MSEPKEQPHPAPEKAAPQSPPANNGDAFRRAENLLAVETQDGNARAQQAFVAIEGREAADRPSNLTDDSDALRRRVTGDERGGDAADDHDKVDDALAEEAREDGVTAANDTSQIVWAMTPHNL